MVRVGLWIGLIAAVLLAVGCVDDFGTACDFPVTPEVEAACGPDRDELGNESVATCVDPINADCESRLCIQHEGSSPFCSEVCDTDADCPSESTCQTGTVTSISGYCLPDAIF